MKPATPEPADPATLVPPRALPRAVTLPGPPELMPGLPDAVIDLQTDEGAALVVGRWRYHDAEVVEIDFVEVGADLGPTGRPNRTYDIVPHAEGVDFDDGDWQPLAPEDTRRRLGSGRVCFTWYRIEVTIPERIGPFDPTGSTAVFEVTVDDYVEVWVDGRLPLALGQTGGGVPAGFNAPSRVILGRGVAPGQRFQLAVFGINGPISASPRNYVWMRGATLDFYAPERIEAAWEAPLEVEAAAPGLDAVLGADPRLERVAGGFVFTEGPVWAREERALLFSSPNTNAVYRWRPEGRVELFRTKSGYSGVDIGRYSQPGSNGLTFSPDGLLTLCQHGNRQVIRVNPHGDVTVLADRYRGMRLNSPNDLVYGSDGALYFTDPPFGLPDAYDDPGKETPFSGVYRVEDGEITLLDDTLKGPNGIALSPDERYLYVGNWDPDAKIVKRYALRPDGAVAGAETFFDMTDAPGEDAIDGIKVDEEGNLYVCGPGGVWVLSAAGEHLGTLRLPEAPHNLAWGDEDGRTLYITALTSIYRLRLAVPGIRP